MKIFVVFLVTLFATQIYGHGWLYNPEARGSQGNQASSASTTSPCGASGNYPQITYLTNGDNLYLQWTIGSGHTGSSGDYCRIAWSTTDSNSTAFDDQVLYTSVNCPIGDNGSNFTIYIPNLTTTTTIYLQWEWFAGDGSHWYGCLELSVTPSSTSITDVPSSINSPIQESISTSTTEYFRIPVSADRHVYTSITSSYVLTFLTQTGSPPSDSTYSDKEQTSSNIDAISVAACGPANTDGYVYLGAEAGSSIGNATYSFQYYIHDAELYIGNASPQIYDTLPYGGSKFYWTEAYDTPDVKKRVVVTKTDGSNSPMKLWKSLECIIDNPNTGTDSVQESQGTTQSCVNLGSTTGRKYIQVTSTDGSAIAYGVGVETGTCADLTSGAAELTASLFVVLLALVVIF